MHAQQAFAILEELNDRRRPSAIWNTKRYFTSLHGPLAQQSPTNPTIYAQSLETISASRAVNYIGLSITFSALLRDKEVHGNTPTPAKW